MLSQRCSPSWFRVQTSIQRRRGVGPVDRRDAQSRLRRKAPAEPAESLVFGSSVARNVQSSSGMLVRVRIFKTDCSQNKKEPIYLKQDCQSCTKQKHIIKEYIMILFICYRYLILKHNIKKNIISRNTVPQYIMILNFYLTSNHKKVIVSLLATLSIPNKRTGDFRLP